MKETHCKYVFNVMGLSYCAIPAHNCTSKIVLLKSRIMESGNMDSISETQKMVEGDLND